MSPTGNLPDIIWLTASDSTNSEALRNLRGLDNMSVVAAVRQYAGKGQGTHTWHSAPGENITATLVLKDCGINASETSLIPAAAATGVCDYLHSRGITAGIKLPNDIWVEGRKICGMLIENTLSGRYVTASLIGLGLNVNQTGWPAELPNPVSMKELTGKDYDIKDELEALRQFIGSRLSLISSHRLREGLLSDFNKLAFRADQKLL